MTDRASVDTTEDPPQDPDAPETSEGGEDRPEWLPEKFDSPEAMAESYQELESRLGQGDDTGDEPDSPDEPEGDLEPEDLEIGDDEVEEAEDEISLDFDSVEEELRENGELSDETYEAFEDAGIPRDRLNTYIEGQRALARESTRKMAEAVGGRENLERIIEWANTNIPEAQAEAYNRALARGNFSEAEVMLRGIASQYTDSQGSEPDLVSGEATGTTSGVKPFKSSEEVRQAMADDRYDTDDEYRAQVERRLSVSEVF